MDWQIILAEMAAFAAVFTAAVFALYGGGGKYSPAAIHNYPPDIQEEYFGPSGRCGRELRSGKGVTDEGDRRAVPAVGILFAFVRMLAGA